ncbi:hypothetical protein F5Y13DRAFT_182515 [Hypoxylon sp. FL1857]|nr:hypothetical protein F5Y13DRAFT_182515 [Hypoxylon sp. FL1857]
MGHLDIVQFLIERGAALAHDGLHASSYVGDEGLAARRRDFFLRTVRIGRENPDAFNTRKTIHDILSSPGRRSVFSAMRGHRADIGFPDFRLAKQGRDIVVYTPVLRVRTDITLDRSKTIGVITAKGNGDVLMAAHSGFRLGGDRGEKCLDTNKWNYIALHNIAALLKFYFPGNRHDNGNKPVEDDEHRGRAHAGHVEVLLAAWYALEMTKKSTGRHDADLEWLLTQLHTLKRATLGDARSATIMIDSQPCATCLKFINRLFQYTGLHFSVKGGVGVGPTLATKSKRHNVRFDTFGDVFELSDGEDSADSTDSGLQSPPTIVRAQEVTSNIKNTVEEREDRDDTFIQAQAASEAFARVSKPRFSPIPDMDVNSDAEPVSPTTPPEVVPPSRVAPITPMRPRMQWPIPERGSRSRMATVEDPFRDIPSRRPANHFELLAEYKKKTPVWDFPGYESVVPEYRPQPPTPRAAAAGPYTTSVFAASPKEDTPTTAMEDTMIVDMTEDNEDVGYPSPGSSSGATTLQNSMVEVNSRIHNSHNNDADTPSPPKRSRAPAVFSYSCFAPILSQHDSIPDKSVNKPPVQSQSHSHHPSQSQSQSQSQPSRPQYQPLSQANTVRSDPFRVPSDSDDEEEEGEYYYVPKAKAQAQTQTQAHAHSQRQLLNLNRPPTAEVISLNSNSDTDSDFDPEEQQHGRDPTPCPVPVPVPGVTRLQQWRYQPQPQPQPQRRAQLRQAVKAGESEGRRVQQGIGTDAEWSILGRQVQPVAPGSFLEVLESGRENGFGKRG